MKRIVDLSMPVHGDMLTFPRVPPPALCVFESHTEFAERIGAAAYGVESLTASELRVAQRAAEGHSNREIAEDLFVTIKTVETHLANAYGKLGIRSRTQLANALAEAVEPAALSAAR